MKRATTLDLLIATANSGKAAEIRAVLGDLPIRCHSLDEFPEIKPVAETGSTYEENAVLKARGYARQTGLWALADDSGLEVKALNGAPGVYSARYAGEGATDADRIEFLLRRLECVASANRNARFVCVAALADSASSLVNVEYGECAGQIINQPRGADGFGYDPIFIPQTFDKTFAELSLAIKNAISHRARALQSMHSFLQRLFDGNEGSLVDRSYSNS
jgi:XTP/dITP diphosphohydrolase